MTYLFCDLVLLAALLAFALWGAHRGMILTLCSLLAVLVAFVGASLASTLLTDRVAQAIEPRITAAIEARLEEAVQNTRDDEPEESGADAQPDDKTTLSGVLSLLEELRLPRGLIASVRASVESTLDQAVTGAAAQVGAALARSLASPLIFLAAFVVILLLWRLLGRTLDLVAKLPGLRLLNRAGGFVFGALRGAVLLYACGWVASRLWGDLLPADVLERTRLLQVFLSGQLPQFLSKA
jgi:uncharacterized membrane protein required for colicin V production